MSPAVPFLRLKPDTPTDGPVPADALYRGDGSGPRTILPGAAKTPAPRLGYRKVMFHALRHTHVSALIAAGVDVVKMSRRLGHADPTPTLRTYAHQFDKVDTATASAIEIPLTQNADRGTSGGTMTRDGGARVPIRGSARTFEMIST